MEKIDIWNQTPEENRAALCRALRSGEFKQGRCALKITAKKVEFSGTSKNGEADSFCCLGVGCEISKGVMFEEHEITGEAFYFIGDDKNSALMPRAVAERFGFISQTALSEM